jgi:5'-deoxynucleotidase
MSSFFAYLSRLRLVQRWGLMRAAEPENVQEHSHQVAVVAHALAVIGVRHYGRSLDPNEVAVVALFHDASEVLTGDLPTPVKHANEEMRTAYKGLETAATQRLLEMLPEGLQEAYVPLLTPTDPEVVQLVKAADKLCGLLKAVQENKAGNREFALAEAALRGQVEDLELPEVRYFLDAFGTSFSLSLDELSG